MYKILKTKVDISINFKTVEFDIKINFLNRLAKLLSFK